jgi:hypothetical protein
MIMVKMMMVTMMTLKNDGNDVRGDGTTSGRNVYDNLDESSMRASSSATRSYCVLHDHPDADHPLAAYCNIRIPNDTE